MIIVIQNLFFKTYCKSCITTQRILNFNLEAGPLTALDQY